jgi:predicted phosphodiesterase
MNERLAWQAKPMSVAAISDVHGNLPALEAVLGEIERLGVDAIVCCGDVAAGPLPRETCERLMALDDARFVRGNADRDMVEGFDSGASSDWDTGQLERRHRDFLASFEPTVTLDVEGLGRALFCHATPDSDMEIITAITPEARLESLVGGAGADVVLCGHVHCQYDRRAGSTRVVNVGSVGLPYEERPGAYWTLLGPDVEHRRTDYEIGPAIERMRAGGHPDLDELLRESLVEPIGPDEVARYFEFRLPGE